MDNLNAKILASDSKRRRSVEGADFFKSAIATVYCNACATFFCLGVLFYLVVLGFPVTVLLRLGLISPKLFDRIARAVVFWGTPLVYGVSMVLSGTEVYLDDVKLYAKAKEGDSLLVSNHPSRVDWVVAVFLAHVQKFGDLQCQRQRLVVVAKHTLSVLPFVGWSSNQGGFCIFLKQSFNKDAEVLRQNIRNAKSLGQSRQILLEAEGKCGDNTIPDIAYALQCREFCKAQGCKPFDYVLTPRYKGMACLVGQLSSGVPIVSCCLVYLRGNKLLSCKILSPSRVVPDLHDLYQGVFGDAVSVYVHVREIERPDHGKFDAKTVLMQDYAWKDSILAKWDKHLANSDLTSARNRMGTFTRIQACPKEMVLFHLCHTITMITFAYAMGWEHKLFPLASGLFLCLTTSHLLGRAILGHSAESIPFETALKALMKVLLHNP